MTRQQLFDQLLDRFSAEIRDGFRKAIQTIADDVVLDELTDQINNGDLQGAVRALGIDQAATRQLTQAIENAFEAGGVFAGAAFPVLNTSNGRAVFRFDVRNTRAEQYLRQKSAEFVTSISADTTANLRTLLEAGTRAGANPRTTALDLVGRIDRATGSRTGGIIGLTRQQKGWVDATRSDLLNLDKGYFSRSLRDKRFDGIVQRAIDTGRPLSKSTVDQLTTRYENSVLRYRAETIGRTESLAALNNADREAHKQAIDTGAAREQDVQRFWDSAGDADVRDSHSELDRRAEGVGINEPFVTTNGDRLMNPGDTSLGAPAEEVVQCRCRVRTKVDWLAAGVAS